MTKYKVITDPCYILSEEAWNKCMDEAYQNKKEKNTFNSKLFSKAVTKALEELTSGKAWVEDTGYGDWSNALDGPNIKGNRCFCADSGMVCVCDYTKDVKKALGSGASLSAAVFKAEGDIEVEFDKSDRHWTYITIEDSKGNFWETYTSNPDDFDY